MAPTGKSFHFVRACERAGAREISRSYRVICTMEVFVFVFVFCTAVVFSLWEVKNAKKHRIMITFEDHNIIGGLGGAVSEILSENHPVKLIRMGIKDKIGRSGEAEQLVKKYNIDEKSLIKQIKRFY